MRTAPLVPKNPFSILTVSASDPSLGERSAHGRFALTASSVFSSENTLTRPQPDLRALPAARTAAPVMYSEPAMIVAVPKVFL